MTTWYTEKKIGDLDLRTSVLFDRLESLEEDLENLKEAYKKDLELQRKFNAACAEDLKKTKKKLKELRKSSAKSELEDFSHKKKPEEFQSNKKRPLELTLSNKEKQEERENDYEQEETRSGAQENQFNDGSLVG